MRKKEDIETNTKLADFMEMAGHPEDFPEAEWQKLLADKDNRENLHVLLLAQRAYRRHTTPVPDVNEAWEELQSKTGKISEKKKSLVILGSLIATAAIIIFGFFLIRTPKQAPALEVLSNAEAQALKTASTQQVQLHSASGSAQTITKATVTFFSSQKENAGGSLQGNQIKTITIPKGRNLKVILSDGTEVWLNAASSITFPVPFDKDKREIKLTGEGYFKVKHENDRPFTVNAGNMSVTVLGTEFNVRAYNYEPSTVTLVNGLVRLGDQASRKQVLLRPNEQGTFGPDGQWTIAPADTYAVTQWVKGYFYYEKVPLLQVVQDLARWYGFNILVKNKTNLDTPIHFSARRDERIRQTVENLNQLQISNLTIAGNNIIIQ